jgi:3-isopropylmalate dehydrogenase
MGMLASASIGDRVGLYEPIHGSAHDITGKGIANPLASILSTALMLDISFGLKEESQQVIDAVSQTLKAGFRTIDIADSKTDKNKILSTEQMGAQVTQCIRANETVSAN